MHAGNDSLAPWIEGMLAVARHYRVETSAENARVLAGWEQAGQAGTSVPDISLARLAGHLGLEARILPYAAGLPDPWRLPLLAEFASEGGPRVGVLEKTDGAGVTVRFSGDQGLTTDVPVEELPAAIRRVLILRPRASLRDIRVDDYIRPCRKG